QVLDESPDDVDVAVAAGTVIGWVCTRIHPEDSMGEVYVIVVDPEHQGHGVGRALMDRAHARVRRAGMRMVMVETGGDPGHGAARRLYEAAGYQRWPVARYFKDLASDPMGPQLGSPEAGAVFAGRRFRGDPGEPERSGHSTVWTTCTRWPLSPLILLSARPFRTLVPDIESYGAGVRLATR